MRYSRKTRHAIQAYGEAACIEAFRMNERGEGAATIAFQGPATLRTTRQADAAIDAGREIVAAWLPEAQAVIDRATGSAPSEDATDSERDVEVLAIDGLDAENASQFEKPWLVSHADGRIDEYDTEDEACAAQRAHRAANGLDPMTGEPATQGTRSKS
jgi:hypothetical protein